MVFQRMRLTALGGRLLTGNRRNNGGDGMDWWIWLLILLFIIWVLKTA